MKKIMMLLAVTMLLFGFNGQAMAYFAQGDLIQVVYSTAGSYEVATDLGAFAPTTAYTGPILTFNSNPFPVAGAPGAFSNSGWSNLQVSYFVNSGTSAWTSGPINGQTSAGLQTSQYTNPSQVVLTNYNSYGTAQVDLLKSNLSSYFTNMDNGGSGLGSFGGFIPAGNGETNLAALSSQSYVDSYLYYYSNAANAATGVQVAEIRTFADGTSEVVPVPPSVLLMGSGLIAFCLLRSALSAREKAEHFSNAV